jgi:hypothetical protein
MDLIIRIVWATTPGVQLLSAEQIDHTGPRPADVKPGVTVEYGQYLSRTCTNCHGLGFSGGAIPGKPPEDGEVFPANLTSNTQTGLGTWTEKDFFRVFREGKRPNGSAISDWMPWKKFGAAMTDDELSALWLFVQTLPAKEYGNR